jgi:hypothetical protein
MRMRHLQPSRRMAYRLANAVYIAALILTCATVGIARLPTPASIQPQDWWRLGLKATKDASVGLIPFCAIAIAASTFAKQAMGSPGTWGAIHTLLSVLRSQLFEAEMKAAAADDEHRVTLFMKSRFFIDWRSPRSWRHCREWLLPVERSGDSTRVSTSRFLVPDKSDAATGVAGRSFYRQKVIFVSDLPALADSTTDDLIADYAKRTWVLPEEIRKRRPKARSYSGVVVLVKGRPSGVLVVDSINDKATNSPDQIRVMELAAAACGAILEGRL